MAAMAQSIAREIRQTKPFRSLEEEVYISIRLTSQVMDQPWARYLRKTEGISPSQYNLLRILRGAGADDFGAKLRIVPVTHMYLSLFSDRDMASTAMLIEGTIWSVLFGLVAGTLIAVIYNALAGLDRR